MIGGMSGKTARRKRAALGIKKEKSMVTVHDAKRIYADVMLELMAEVGIDQRTCTKEQIESVIRECSDQYMETYDDYLVEVLYDGDRTAVEIDLVASQVMGMTPMLMGM